MVFNREKTSSDVVAYPSDKSKALVLYLAYIFYCTFATYTGIYIHAIYNHGVGCSHKSLFNTSDIAHLRIYVYASRYCPLAYKMCI